MNEPEYRVVELRDGCPTGLFDDNDREICVGDLVREQVSGNTKVHGTWCIYRVVLRGIIPVLSYVRSEAGAIWPDGYTGSVLSSRYDQKMLLWANDLAAVRPDVGLVVVDPDSI